MFAPAVRISSAGYSGYGTSLAAPHVTGLIAQLIEAYPSIALNPRLIKATILAGGHDFTGSTYSQTSTYDSTYCAGLIDAKTSFKILSNAKYVTGTLTSSTYNKTLNVPNSWNYIRVALVWDKQITQSNALNNIDSQITDLDIAIFNSSFAAVEGSMSVNNTFELFYYPITEAGTYTLRIIRRDSSTTPIKFALVWW